jgi:hypothetical protein
MTSPDGITWTSRISAADNQWQSVTYGNGLFVAVANTGTGNRVMTSPNGITWTIRTSAANNGWLSVTYGNGLFVAVAISGTGDRVMTSPDGINWTIRTSAADNQWNGVTFGNGLFVAVAYSGTGNRVMTSADVFAPSSPSITSITPAGTYASVAFTAPTSSGYSAITNYEYSKNNGSTWVTPSPAVTTSPFTIMGLSSGTTYPIQLRAVNSVGSGCGSSTVVATTCIPNTFTETISACVSYLWHGTTYTSSNNTATWNGINASGCDSVVTLNLTINAIPSTPSVNVVNNCNGTSTLSTSASGALLWSTNATTSPIIVSSAGTYTVTTTVNGCVSAQGSGTAAPKTTSTSTTTQTATGSYTWNNTTYSSSGVYTYHTNNAAGCDSAATLNLTINQIGCISSSSSETTAECNSYSWHGNTYTTSGIYTWTGTNAGGCDSVVTLNLTINATPSTPTVNVVNNCNGTSTLSTSASGTLLWSTNATTSPITVSSAGTYTVTTTVNGCVSASGSGVAAPKTTSTSTTTETAIGSYTWNSTTYSSSGVYTYHTNNAAGCDSAATLNLTINQIGCTSTSSSETTAECNSYSWHANTYTTSGIYTWTGTNAAGCDSVVTLNLTINAIPLTPSVNVVNNCNGTSTLSTSASGTLLWSTNATTSPIIVSSAGTYTVTTTVNGCVSAQGYGTAAPKTTSTSTTTQTATGSYTWNTTTYSSSGVYTYHTNNAAGCDSAATLNLTINAINNITNVCNYIGSNVTLTYTASVAGASSYAWTLPPNTQLISGQGTRSIEIKLLNGFASQSNKQIRVTPAGGSLQIIYLGAQTPVTPSTIVASSTNICANLGTNVPVNFKIPRALEAASNGTTASSYIWTAQNGTTNITHPNGVGEYDTIVAITFASNFTSSNVTVQAVNACGVSGSRSYLITLGTPSQPGLISGPTNSCAYIGSDGQSATYAVTGNAYVDSYNWTIPVGAIGFTGQGTRTISFQYPAGYTVGSISVTTTNGCGTSPSRSLTVSRLLPASPGNIDVINTQSCPNRVYTYSIASLPFNATSLLWTIPVGASLVSGQGSTSITVSYPPGVVDEYVTVKSVANCGLSSAKKSQVRMAPCPVNPSPGFTKGLLSTSSSAMDVKVFPNPTTSSFNLQVNTNNNKVVSVKIMDIQGRIIKSFATTSFQTNNIGYELRAGVYMVEVKQGEEVKKVRVVKY